MARPLNIGMIGYGFMGRAHSNAYSQVNHFFDLQYRPVLKAICARDEAKAKAFAATWGYRVGGNGLAQTDRAQGYRRDRHLHAQQHAPRDCPRRSRGGQDRFFAKSRWR